MWFPKNISASQGIFTPKAYTLREIIFDQFTHRNENATVIRGHNEEKLIDISLGDLRVLIGKLGEIIREKKLVKGDTVLLASFYSSNELATAVLFSAFACLGIRLFIPIYPEVNEFERWLQQTRFKAVIIPYKEILQQRGHEKEKEVIGSISSLCNQHDIPFWDAFEDFDIPSLLQQIKEKRLQLADSSIFCDDLTTETDAVIFTTSGTSGKCKLVVYKQGAFSVSCQSWQQAGLFDPAICGNPGFTPLFTHTIGIRSFINALWTGNPLCILVTDWFLHRPEVARYLLLQMRPGYITGGPALFSMLIEFFRQYPELKISLAKNLKTLISIGAPFDPATAKQIKNALGLDLLNAFGTTETQMVLLNREVNEDPGCLGEPLPGVSIGLKETATEEVYELYIRSPYHSSYVIGESKADPYFSSGDLVSYNAAGTLRYALRKGTDFIKDGFGVKVPVAILREYYPLLYNISAHIEWIPLDNKPGLAAFIFLHPSCIHYSLKEISEWVKNRNEILQSGTEPFEFSHRHLERISLGKNDAPTTRKGTFSRNDFLQCYEEIIRILKNPYAADSRIESVDAEKRSLLYKFSNPRLASLLEALMMDVHYEKGEKDTLYYQKNGKQKAVLDLVGGFGSGLLGHDHPAVKNAIRKFLDTGQPPINTQGSLYYYPSLLARELNRLFSQNTGKYFKAQFGNTGAESVEIALHHAWYEWWTTVEKTRDEQLQRYGSLVEIDVAALWHQNLKNAMEAQAAVIVINNCFHGYTSAARSLLTNKKQRFNFSGLLKLVPLHINDNEENWKEQVETYKKSQCLLFKTVVKENDTYVIKEIPASTIIASIIEPVRGEGGIYETKPAVADYLSEQSFPLIADEIQCGLGRTGSIPSYPNASYYLLGKSLGGGYEKISAVLIDEKRFKISFPQYYSSTFANGEMAACAALAALDVIVKEKLAETAHEKGIRFITKLRRIANKYPDVIESVGGKGMMLGIHFNKQAGKENILLRTLCENELLGYLLSGWLFHNKNIRVLPSLSKPDAIRIEPSVYITGENMDIFCNALEELCALCRNGSMYELFRYLMNEDPYLDRPEGHIQGKFPVEIEKPGPGALKVGFIGNFTMPPRELMVIERDLQKASDTGLRILFDKMQTLLEGKPLRLFSKNLMRGKVHFTFYILPFDTAHLEMVHRFGKKRYYIARIQEAVNCLSNEGVSHISLGAHASILSGNGLYLAESNKVKILTGNTLTVASCLYHTEQYIEHLSHQPGRPVTIAITGANGNIGSGLAGCFDEDKYGEAKIILIGNNLKKLESLRKRIFARERTVLCSTDLFLLQKADIIISCTNSNDPLIFPRHVHPEKNVFIVDIAVPGSVSEEVKRMDNVSFCRDASAVYLPDDPDFLISSHTPPGKIFCCAAEVMLAALYDVQLPLKGHIRPEAIRKMMELALREGIFNRKEYAPLI